jgi:hypothetical protein
MKLPLCIALAASLSLAANAQNAPQNTAPTGKPKQELEVTAPLAPKTNEVNTNILSSAKSPKEPKEPTVSYGGVLTDIRKSTNRFKTFSLRRRVNLKEDDANLIRNVRTEGGPAVKVFSVDF